MVAPFPPRPQPMIQVPPPMARPPAPPMGQVVPFPAPGPMGTPPPEPPPPPGPRNLQPWQEPKKPQAKRVIEQAHRDRDRFAGYAEVVATIARRLDLDAHAIFDSEADKPDVEPFYSPALKIEHDRFCSWGANHDFTIRAPNTDPLNREEAAEKEDAGYYWLECWAKQHADAGYGDLPWALFDTLATYGRLATLVTCDFFDDVCGFTFRTLDPATTFPFFEGKRGLQHVSMVYGASAAELLGYYGDPEGKLERKLKKETSTKHPELGLDAEGEVIEWIDRAHHVVLWEGVEIKNSRHGYGFVPVRYDRGPWGRQAFTSSTAIQTLSTASWQQENARGAWEHRIEGAPLRGGPLGAGRLDEAKVGLPFQYWKLRPHRVMESFMSLNLTALKRQIDPAWNVTQGRDAARQGMPDIEVSTGRVNTFREDERVEMVQLQIQAQQAQLVAAQLMQDQSMGSVGTVAYGMAPPQTTGSAATILDAEGKEIWAPGIRCVQNHVAGVLEMCATLHRDWGDLQGAPGSRGTLRIPRHNSRAGTSQAFDLTPETIRRVGVRYLVELHRFNIGTIAQTAAGITQLRAAGVIGQEDGMRMLGFERNPIAAMQRIREEQLSEAPAILLADQLERLVMEYEVALQRGDDDTATRKMARLTFVGDQMMQEEQRKALMIQQQMLGVQEREMTMARAEQREIDKQLKAEEEAIAAEEEGAPPGHGNPGLPPPRQPLDESPIPAGGVASLPSFGIPAGTNGGRPRGMIPVGMGD